MNSLPDTSYTLLSRLADAADVDAWREFAEIYEPAVIRFARRRGLQETDARDVAQETLAAVAQSLDQWTNRVATNPKEATSAKSTGEPKSFRAWLYTVARNLAVNRLTRGRDRQGRGGDPLLSLETAPSPMLASAFDREYRLAAIAWAGQHVEREVAPETWKAFYVTAVEGIPIPQAAQRLGMQIGSVYAARSRVMAKLKARIDALDENQRDALHEQVESEMHKQAVSLDADESSPEERPS